MTELVLKMLFGLCLNQIVIRRLPPSLTKEELEEQLQPLPDVDYLEFFSSDTRFEADSVGIELNEMTAIRTKTFSHERWSNVLFLYSLYPHLFARAYLNFKNQEDIVLFRDRFDGYVFIDNRGLYRNLLQSFFVSLLHPTPEPFIRWFFFFFKLCTIAR